MEARGLQVAGCAFGGIFEWGAVDPIREFAELRTPGKAIMVACMELFLCQHF